MFIKLILVFAFLTTFALAQDVSVDFGLSHFELDLNQIKKSKCNEKMIEDFNKEVKHALTVMNKKKVLNPEEVKVSWNKSSTSFPRNSPEGKYFLNLSSAFKKLKIKSQLKCQK